MQIFKWLGVVAALVLLVACHYPWVTIESKNIVVSGVSAVGTTFGKPGYFHIIVIALYLPLLLINRLWSKRINLFLSGLNIGWAFRNFILISTCQGGECPVKHPALYITVIASIFMLVFSMLTPPRT